MEVTACSSFTVWHLPMQCYLPEKPYQNQITCISANHVLGPTEFRYFVGATQIRVRHTPIKVPQFKYGETHPNKSNKCVFPTRLCISNYFTPLIHHMFKATREPERCSAAGSTNHSSCGPGSQLSNNCSRIELSWNSMPSSGVQTYNTCIYINKNKIIL